MSCSGVCLLQCTHCSILTQGFCCTSSDGALGMNVVSVHFLALQCCFRHDEQLLHRMGAFFSMRWHSSRAMHACVDHGSLCVAVPAGGAAAHPEPDTGLRVCQLACIKQQGRTGALCVFAFACQGGGLARAVCAAVYIAVYVAPIVASYC